MESLNLELTAMANGGAALGRDDHNRVIFVPLAIPGERVSVQVVDDRKRYAWARLLDVIDASPDRITPRCPHFGPCSGCHFQHIEYRAQLKLKEEVVRDQLNRIGGMGEVNLKPVWPNPEPWNSSCEIRFALNSEGKLGFWSTALNEITPVDTCHLIHPELLALMQYLNLTLPELRRISLRMGNDGDLLVILEIEGVDPPKLETDFPVSAAMVLPDGRAVNLVGDNYLVHSLRERDFRVSAGCFFYPSPLALNHLIDTVLDLTTLNKSMKVLEMYSGVGTLTAFLAAEAGEIAGIELNPDAVSDAALNLSDHNNVSIYEGPAEEILPLLEFESDVIIVDPPDSGLPKSIVDQIARINPDKLLYISSDTATLARDTRQLSKGDLSLAVVQPIDMYPLAYRTTTVSLWLRNFTES